MVYRSELKSENVWRYKEAAVFLITVILLFEYSLEATRNNYTSKRSISFRTAFLR